MTTLSYDTRYCLLLLALLTTTLANAQDQPTAGTLFPRKYQVGETYRYRLTTEQFYNGQWKGTSVVVMELTVIKDSAGLPCDEVRSISKIEYSPKDTINLDAEARAVKPYRISLHPNGKIAIPAIEVPGMTGPITDFITFFVAVSPQSRITTLQKKGDSLARKELAKGNFANGKTILVGDDCLAITAYVTDVTPAEARLRTRFLPPREACLSFLLPDMAKPVTASVLNNFQMVQAAGPGKYNVQFGNEEFTINSVLSRKDGKITAADMSNTLQLSLRIQCDSTYKNCLQEVPFSIQRNLKLELL